MLYAGTREQRWRWVCAVASATALLLVVWVVLEVQRLREGHGSHVLEFGGTVTSFAYICAAVSPSLPVISVALIPSALAVMAPCLLQMSIVLVTAIGSAASTQPQKQPLWQRGFAFAGGFLGIYATAALLLGLAGQFLSEYAFALKAIGGALIVLLGLAALRVLPQGALSGCRGPHWLLMTGKATLRRPFGAGVAFAVYCVGCCGPYISGLALLGAGSGSFARGAGLMLCFALLMGVLLLLPIFALGTSRQVGQALMKRARPIATISGAALVAIGTMLVLEPLVVWVFVS